MPGPPSARRRPGEQRPGEPGGTRTLDPKIKSLVLYLAPSLRSSEFNNLGLAVLALFVLRVRLMSGSEKGAMKLLREGPARITKATIEAVWRRREKDQRIIIGDAACRGLALVVHQTGMAWRFDYKPRGTDPLTGKRFASRSVTIGNPQTHSPDEARQAAGNLKGQQQAGDDPGEARKAKVAAAAERRGRTVERMLDDYAKALPSRPKLRGNGKLSPQHIAGELSNGRAAVAAMKAETKPVAELGVADLRTLLRATEAQPGAAKHRYGAVSRFLDWCQDEGAIASNPCLLVAKSKRPKAVAARQHCLALTDLASLWLAAGDEATDLEPVQRDYLRFLITIPCRRTEAAKLDWSHVDLDAAVWTQPGRLTKNGDTHRLHLHSLALDVLVKRHEAAGKPKAGFVFPAPKSGKPLSTFSAIKAAVASKVDAGDWRLHDFRRSFATALGEAGFAEPVVDAVLNHRQAATRGGVLGVYQRAQRWPEQVKAMQAWGEMLANAVEKATQVSQKQAA